MLRLKELRNLRNLSQSDAAEKLGISRQAYIFYETGKRSPDVETLKKMSKLFNTSLDYLFGLSNHMDISDMDIADLVHTLETKKLLFDGTQISDENVKFLKKTICLIALETTYITDHTS